MRTLTKIIFFTLLALGLYLLFALWTERKENARLQHNISELQTIISQKPTLVKEDSIVFRDVHHNIYKDKIVVKEIEKEIAVGKPLLDSVTKALKIAQKDLVAVSQVNARLSVENKKLSKVGAGKVEYKDNFVYVLIDRDSSNLDKLTYDAQLNTAFYEKREGFFRGKEQYIDIFSPDERFTIGGVKSFTVKPKKVTAKLSIDNRIWVPFKDGEPVQLSSQLLYQSGLEKVLNYGVGGGVFYDIPTGSFIPVGTVNLNINLLKIRK